MKKIILVLAAAVVGLAQQTAAPAPVPLAPGEVIRVVEIKQGNAYNIWDNLRQIFPGISQTNGRLIIRGQSAVADMMEEAIKKLDIPVPIAQDAQTVANVELVVQLLYGSAKQEPGILPTDLDSTVKQLKAVFPYKGYRLIDTQIFHVRDNREAHTEGPLPGGSHFSFYVSPRVALGELGKRQVRLSNLRLDLALLISGEGPSRQTENARISTDLDAREGQKTVVGKANVTNTEDAIILVVTPKVIE